MDDSELLVLLNDLESDRVERKASLADRDRIREAICAFANDIPDHGQAGVILVGVDDDGGCMHLAIRVHIRILSAWPARLAGKPELSCRDLLANEKVHYEGQAT
jgi:ATP-dependent DNA helicase RecG